MQVDEYIINKFSEIIKCKFPGEISVTFKIILLTVLLILVSPVSAPPLDENPIITLLGFDPVTIEAGFSYADAGATALDDVDGDITSLIETVNPVNTSAVGIYTVTYNVNYNLKNPGKNKDKQKTRTVKVVDNTPPTIDAVTPIIAEATSSSGATVTIIPPMSHDVVDGDLASSCDASTGTFSIGVTTVTCTKTDTNSNAATPSVFTVTVQDTTAPTIDSVTPIVAEATSSSGATVTITPPMSHDVVDGDLASICDKSTGTFPLGVTTVTCTKTDSHGNAATPFEFTVAVQDTTKPVITLNDRNPKIVLVDSTYTDAGVTVTDNYDTSLTATVTGTVNTAVKGTNIITYNVKDSSNNSATEVTRTVNVMDRAAPDISISITSPTDGQGFSVVSIPVSGTASYNAANKIEVKVGSDSWLPVNGTASWSVDSVTLAEGSNIITARVTDASDNVKETSVNVTYTPSGVETADISITSPTDGQGFSVASIAVSGTASKTLSKIEVKVGNGS
ncbi:hypothetical protein METP3_00821 [Methanosarcinales archaeon]|nr:hypothetical protein METP3_00821 [Methanosarcinales archaeon]